MMKSSGRTAAGARSQPPGQADDRQPGAPPALHTAARGRTGSYGPDHVARLELIREMQADGFNLEAIKRVLARTPPGAAEPTLEFDRELRKSWQGEAPPGVAADALVCA